MNERIKELAHEVGLPTYNPAGIPTKLEKFAELIVRECAKVITQGGYWNHALKGRTQASPPEIAKMIKEHFGIDGEEDIDETCPRCGDNWSGTSCGIPDCGWVTGVTE